MVARAVPAPHRPDVGVKLLDRFRLVGADEDTLPSNGQRLVALLALRERVDRSTAAGVLWPAASEEHALGCLRTTLWRVRRAVAGLLHVSRQMIELDPGVAVDVRVLDRLARRLRAGCGPEDAAEVLTLGVGKLLPGWDEEWVFLERERLRQVQVIALCDLARAFAAAGDSDSAVFTAYRALSLEMLRESTHRLLVELHIAAGDYGEAIRRFSQSRDLFATELGVRPSPQMAQLLDLIPRPLTGSAI